MYMPSSCYAVTGYNDRLLHCRKVFYLGIAGGGSLCLHGQVMLGEAACVCMARLC